MTTPTQSTHASPWEAIRKLTESIRLLLRDGLQLVRLETRLAISSLVMIAALGVGAALLGLTAWILLVLALVAWLAQLGLGPAGAPLVVGIVLALAIVPIVLMIRKYADNLSFRATRRQLGSQSHEPSRAAEEIHRAG